MNDEASCGTRIGLGQAQKFETNALFGAQEAEIGDAFVAPPDDRG